MRHPVAADPLRDRTPGAARRSLWRSELEAAPTFEPLTRAIDADVVVVGGGLAGLGTALDLLATSPGLDLVLLEAHDLGHGASGRNAGIVESPLLMPIWLLEGSLPPDEARWALRYLHRRVEKEMKRWLAVCTAGCVRPARVLFAARSRLAGAALRYAQAQAEAAGLPARWCGADAVAATTGSRGFGAIAMPGYTVNPIGLVHAVAESLRRAGGRIFERTAVTGASNVGPDGVELRTGNGTRVRARSVVLSVGAWSRGSLDRHRPPVWPVATYILATEPLDDATLARLGGENICLSEVFSMTYRRIHRRRLLFGGTTRVLRDPEPAPGFDRRRIAVLRRAMQSSLPWLADVRLEAAWGGPTTSTPRAVPLIAPDPLRPGIYWNTGYHAFLPALLSGASLRGLVLGSRHEDPEGERLRRAYMATRVPWGRLPRLGLELIARAVRGG